MTTTTDAEKLAHLVAAVRHLDLFDLSVLAGGTVGAVATPKPGSSGADFLGFVQYATMSMLGKMDKAPEPGAFDLPVYWSSTVRPQHIGHAYADLELYDTDQAGTVCDASFVSLRTVIDEIQIEMALGILDYAVARMPS
jgi:hypothetical protein